jgi:hypothetical protein
VTIQPDRARNIMVRQSLAKGTRSRCHFLGGSDTRIIMGFDEAALIRLSHEQNVQMKCQRSFGLITGDPRRTRAHVPKSSAVQAPRVRPVRRKRSRASYRQRQPVVKLTTLITVIRILTKAHAILWQKLCARSSEHTFDRANRVLVSRVATDLDIRDRVSMQTGRLSQVPNRQIERGPSDHVQLPRAPKCAHLTCDKATTIFITSPNRGGSSELQTI